MNYQFEIDQTKAEDLDKCFGQRFGQAIELFDAYNQEDPSLEVTAQGTITRELLYAKRMTLWLQQIAPEASEYVYLAARAQHIGRWQSPRGNYPKTRPGYRQWREDLGRHHAKIAGDLMKQAGYKEDDIQRVQTLLCKENIKGNPEMQLLEDTICIVFLVYYFDAFAPTIEEHQKLIKIIQRTWKKMSEQGHQVALNLVGYLASAAQALIKEALA